jgi:PAS domain S-box-containing protein
MKGEGKTGELELGKVLEAVARLGEGAGIARSEQEMAEHLLGVLSSLFPDHMIAVRSVQPATGKLVARAATGRECPESIEPQPPDGSYRPVFDDAACGVEVPLRLNDELAGVINLEASGPLLPDAPAVVEALAAVFFSFLRDRRLSRDAKFLRKWLTTTIDNANALIFVVDTKMRVTMVNRTLADLLGCPPEEVQDRDVRRWVSPGQREEVERWVAMALAGRSVDGQELTLVRQDNELVPTIFNLARPSDVLGSVVAIGQDVSTVKALEHQVMQAEKLASLGQLVAGVVHEINNPLTSITVYADYLIKKFRKAGCEESDVSMLERILQGSNRILKFTRDLVDYGKPTGSESDVLSLNEIVEQSISFCEHVLDRSGAELTVSLATDLPPIYGVKDQLQQVIINLLTNACHALDDGGELTIATRYEGRRVAVEVADSGRGIPTEDLPSIFEPFFTTKTPGEGTGLGLSIVKKIVDFHSGTIMVESETGKGTTFSITLPTGHDERSE